MGINDQLTLLELPNCQNNVLYEILLEMLKDCENAHAIFISRDKHTKLLQEVLNISSQLDDPQKAMKNCFYGVRAFVNNAHDLRVVNKEEYERLTTSL